MNNNRNDEAALLGVFQKTGFISFGAEGKPLEYGLKSEHVRECYKGKQMGIIAPREGKTVDAYFEKAHKWISDGEKYVDKWRYAGSQEKKRGFGTSDFSKRDEFSHTVRTLQWREQLAHEAKWTREAIAFFNEAAEQTGGLAAATGSPRGGEAQPALYDLVHEKPPDRTAPACSKVHRDTHNRTMLSHDRALGGALTTSRLHFPAPGGDLAKPEFARRPLVRGTFYRRCNVTFPPDCDAAGGAA
ncbi:flagellar associated protein [Raphidocelis subcapitata]|uniref:Flagellar associated protein n=1 Tax=Raphidocelis subcapitata TaxID=307507 RepID=A0A2V0P0N2_9CHLO|nr:flagellar associated protein [Raphidocelis subcapitata]|eukprot:GBF91400.1 flagellar associated protein [Raphidocelis subcapitata]